MNAHLQKILIFIERDEQLTAEQKNELIKSLKDADKELEITAFKLDRTEKVKKTTAILLEETIEELEQKRKAVEAQNRELEIEAALERVRSKAMAMHKSEDLNPAVATVFEELEKLSPGMSRCGIGILDEEKRTATTWITSMANEGATVQISGEEPLDVHPLLHGAFNAWLTQEDFSYVLRGKDMAQYYKTSGMGNVRLPESQLIFSEDELTQQYYHFASFRAGGLFAFHDTDFPEEVKTVMKRFAGVFDLTYQRFLDIQKAEAQALEAIKRASELQATQKQLIQSEKMASLGELTAGIAHEIQNPLNFVNNFSELNKELLTDMKDELNQGNLEEAKSIANDVIINQEKINHHGKRAEAIVKGMLQHSRASSGVKEPTDINALADEYLRLAYHGLRAKDKSFNATMKTDYDESIGLINVVPQDIGRVILNLITNAFYAVSTSTPRLMEGGVVYEPTVTIITKKQLPHPGGGGSAGATVEIHVKDNGNGIPQNILDKIFQPFFTTKPTGQGTGLGLSLSYDIVKVHGGELKVETKEGEGTEFIIILPQQENQTNK